MGILKPAEIQSAYLKMGIFGFQGSGKSFTAYKVAVGLHKFIGSDRPIAYYDTETGSDYLIGKFDAAGVKLLVVKSRSLSDLTTTIKEAEDKSHILIIDSITHPWREFLEAYKRKTKKKFIRVQDWGRIKPEWARNYADLYVNSKLHIIMCGRAGNIFADIAEDEDNEKSWKAVKVGTKMSAETETGYEPSLLIEIEKVFTAGTGKHVRRAAVIKDRFDVIDSKEFDNPDFNDFMPHIKLLNIGGEHLGVETINDSSNIFDDKGMGEYARLQKKKEIAIDEIVSILSKYFPGSKDVEKRAKGDIVEAVLGTRSWKKITEEASPEDCISAVEKINRIINDPNLVKILGEESSPDESVLRIRGLIG
ncbi:MAG: AAA family ATPase [Thermodesulfobacteriota bacterium]|nr:AAA family ATPase [Thermodesulfobacteriota bacterium]